MRSYWNDVEVSDGLFCNMQYLRGRSKGITRCCVGIFLWGRRHTLMDFTTTWLYVAISEFFFFFRSERRCVGFRLRKNLRHDNQIYDYQNLIPYNFQLVSGISDPLMWYLFTLITHSDLPSSAVRSISAS